MTWHSLSPNEHAKQQKSKTLRKHRRNWKRSLKNRLRKSKKEYTKLTKIKGGSYKTNKNNNKNKKDRMPMKHVRTNSDSVFDILQDQEGKDISSLFCGFSHKKYWYHDWYSQDFIYSLFELYPSLRKQKNKQRRKQLELYKGILDMIDFNEESCALISQHYSQLQTAPKNLYPYTHLEIDPMLLMGSLTNQLPFLLHMPYNQLFQACNIVLPSTIHALSYPLLQYQTHLSSATLTSAFEPIVQSEMNKSLENGSGRHHCHGHNVVIAIIACKYTQGENNVVLNKASVDRGLFLATDYWGMEDIEVQSETVDATIVNVNTVANVEKKSRVDYSILDTRGVAQKDKAVLTNLTKNAVALIGKITKNKSNSNNKASLVETSILLESFELEQPKNAPHHPICVEQSCLTIDRNNTHLSKVFLRELNGIVESEHVGDRTGFVGNVGLLMEEEDLPFTRTGLRPDILIHPSAISSDGNVAMLLELLFSKLACNHGSYMTGFGNVPEPEKSVFMKKMAELMVSYDMQSEGYEMMYDGCDGVPLEAKICVGMSYISRVLPSDKPKTIDIDLTNARHNLSIRGCASLLTDNALKNNSSIYVPISHNTGLSMQVDAEFKTGKPYVDAEENVPYSWVSFPSETVDLLNHMKCYNVASRFMVDGSLSSLRTLSFSDNLKKLLGPHYGIPKKRFKQKDHHSKRYTETKNVMDLYMQEVGMSAKDQYRNYNKKIKKSKKKGNDTTNKKILQTGGESGVQRENQFKETLSKKEKLAMQKEEVLKMYTPVFSPESPVTQRIVEEKLRQLSQEQQQSQNNGIYLQSSSSQEQYNQQHQSPQMQENILMQIGDGLIENDKMERKSILDVSEPELKQDNSGGTNSTPENNNNGGKKVISFA